MLKQAYTAFEKYLDGFDRSQERIRLKITHTYGVVRCANEIAKRKNLSEEDKYLAELIALLHDIGRFEQVRRFDSFEPGTMDHAAFGVDLLFEENENGPMIRQFVSDDRWDDLIRTAIAQHSQYQLENIEDEQTLLHAQLIRDADKLDNCRVKLEDSLEVLLGMDAEAVGAQRISDTVWQSCLEHKAIRSEDRVTKVDYWVSYVAYFFDIYFPETFSIIKENDYVMRIIRRIPYSCEDTRMKMEQLGEMLINENGHAGKVRDEKKNGVNE